jgi:IclR family acetate operon transcriptional repressor
MRAEEGRISVRSNQSVVRAFAVLEAIATHTPIGVSELARLLDLDKNAVQRAIVSLAELGWIAPAPGRTKGWELTAHIFAVAYQSHSKNDLRLRAKVELDALRNETGETTLLTVPDLQHFIVADVFESRQVLRTTPNIGRVTPVRESATGLAILPYMARAKQEALLGGAPDEALLDRYRLTLERGYGVSIDAPIAGVTSIASPIFEADGTPCAAVVVISPTERMPQARQAEIGNLVLKVARSLSRGIPAVAA